jgi:alkylation response protein AidB-like acyl-CoA dehydrogenase
MKAIITHPSEFLQAFTANEIRNESFQAEQEKNLTALQLHHIHQRRWFNMYVPKEFGGLELSLPEILRIEEGLSWADGSTGWVVTLCSGAAWFIGFLDAQLVHEVYKNDQVCIAGSGAISGTANKTNTGYEINGYWKYATGAILATAFTVNCHVKENGIPQYNPDGSPVVTSFLLKKGEVKIHPTWNSMGMIATGSHAIEANKIVVPLNRAFIIQPSRAKLSHPVFQYPFLQLAETTLAVNLSGMAYRFLDMCSEVVLKKKKTDLNPIVQDRRALFTSIRSDFYVHTDATWETLLSNTSIPETMLQQVSLVSHQLVHYSRDLINDLYSFCGLEAADTRTEINRVWRNFHTAAQHSLFSR